MTTTVVKTIGSGGDYTTLQAWEDACPANLVTADQVWQGQVKNASDNFTAGLLISGTTVDATRYVELTTATGASFRDNASVQSNPLRADASKGCAITLSSGYSECIKVSQEYVRISNLQIINTGTTGSHYGVDWSFAGLVTLHGQMENCIIEKSTFIAAEFVGASVVVDNCLFINRGSGKTGVVDLFYGPTMVNCTLAVPSDKTASGYAIQTAYGSAATIKNCALYNNGGTLRKAGGVTPTYTTCYTDVASPPTGCTQAAYSTSQFVNITDSTRDYRIPSGSALVDHGTTDVTNAGTDIAKTARPQGSAYDVGAWELVVAAGGFFGRPYYEMIGRGANV